MLEEKAPNLTAARWLVEEFIYVEFLKSTCILIDIGPFPHNPSDEETDKAYDFLQKAGLDYLTLGELEWVLDLDRLSEKFPALKPERMTGKLTHPPAFETTQMPIAPRFFSGRNGDRDETCFLRIAFDFTPTPEVSEEPEVPEAASIEDSETPPPNWKPPKFIS